MTDLLSTRSQVNRRIDAASAELERVRSELDIIPLQWEPFKEHLPPMPETETYSAKCTALITKLSQAYSANASRVRSAFSIARELSRIEDEMRNHRETLDSMQAKIRIARIEWEKKGSHAKN